MRRAAIQLASAAALLLAACAGTPPAPSSAPPSTPPIAQADAVAPVPSPAPAVVFPAPPGAPPFAALAARFRERALQQEKAGRPRQAFESWQVVAALRPDADEPRRRVADLEARLSAEASRRYTAGIARLREGDNAAARRELLLALAADPGHAGALEALKNRLDPHAATHTVAAGETFAAIATRYYGDAAQAALVALVNDFDPAGLPAAGTVIAVPALTPARAKAPPAARRPGAAAEPGAAQESGYDTEPASIAPDAAPAPAPSPPPAPVPPDRAEQRRRREKAEEFYTAGVRHYINQRLDEAIRSWERALELNPEHPKAAKDIEKARALQQKLRDIR